ncbi:metallophosphoesterase [Paenibacillus soyae]|uniref:Metallophosphoesterase n=1 Tax=Paenibacillus soyae TaxID=2969249 RepID=A0A9X2MNZ6_9BACL|nr:metallophosphoesterase [Paenibacillus soyae]MCR2803579.1 metallophosphoesterase [Paenibacillus soyae]
MGKRKRRGWLYFIGAVVVILLFLYLENNAIGVTTYKVTSAKLPNGIDGYRIVQLSDLQSKEFGRDQEPLLRKVEKLKPDIIVVTGDLSDSNHFNAEASYRMMEGAAKIAPVYFIRGNHEHNTVGYPALEERLKRIEGIHILQNEHVILPAGDGVIRLVGVDDPIFNQERDGDVDKMNAHLDEALAGIEHPEAYTILLSHRPELLRVYADYGMDLSFAGHAHGGQFRVPFVGGVYAPEQGFWPKYTEGRHRIGSSELIISRGLGNSRFPQRVFNRPEIVVAELSRTAE